MAATRPDEPILSFASRADWAAWLAQADLPAAGVWLRIARKGSGEPSVSYDEAVEVAIAFGWIDARKDRLDDGHWLQRFTPRGPRSKWSRRNRGLAETLIARGEMQPAGLRAVEQAKATGAWQDAYESQAEATVPDDLAAALAASPAAARFFGALDARNRYAILYRIHDARRPETRARRIATFVAMLAEGRTIYP